MNQSTRMKGKSKVIILALVAVAILSIFGSFLLTQKINAGFFDSRSIDYTDLVRTRPYPVITTQINRDVKVNKVELFYRFKEQKSWDVRPMKSVSKTRYLITYKGQIPEYLRVDSQIFYYVKFTNKDGSWITRPDGAPKSYFDLGLRLTTEK